VEIRTDEVMERVKKEMADQAGLPFVSTNDVLTSACFKAMGTSLGMMAVNARGRSPGLHDDLAGNYEGTIFYMPADYETPGLIRASLASCRRAASPATDLTSPEDLAAGSIGLVTNWAGFGQELRLPGATQLVHMPTPMPPNYRLPYQGAAVIFAPSNQTCAVCISKDHADPLRAELGELLLQ